MSPDVTLVFFSQAADATNMPLVVYASLVAIPLVMLATMHFGYGRRFSDMQTDLALVKKTQKDHDKRLRDLDKW